MAVEEHPMFKMLEQANKRLHARQEFYQAVKEKYPASNSLVQSAKKAVEEATTEVAAVIKEI
jgi:hypothetical protein